MSLARELTRGLLQLLYPGVCAVCDRSLDADAYPFCPACRAALLADAHPTCPRCAASVGPFVPLEDGCTHCRDSRFHFEGVSRLGSYEGVLRDVILRLKQYTGEGLAEHLGALWAVHAHTRLQAIAAEVIVPVPLHWWRRWLRGYNQSDILARALARQLHIPCGTGWLRRVRPTPPQTRQTPSGRWQNVRGAFRARPGIPVRGKTVLLVDDVLTTGSTCSEAARALREAGAARVHVTVLAKSPS